MQITHSVAQLDAALAAPHKDSRRVALVPTMGNLHAGHLALVARARREAPCVVVSIFVNPLQFGPGEDFSRYPRTLEEDCRKLGDAGVDVVFAPAVEDMYPNGYPPATVVHVAGPLADHLEGAFRPGHFDGVATVVTTLLNRVRPDVAVFGEKDWQQLQVIRRLVSDLGTTVEILGEAIVRDADGLALSSRNQYLSAAERAIAPKLHAGLQTVADALETGRRDFAELCREQMAHLTAARFLPQYIEIRRPDLSAPTPSDTEFVVLVAAWLGKTRLIDNVRATTARTS
ncbi:MAG TPA: pantoate--beta-alanine ligase [Nevskiaceae bacterium]|nr:pantoate--beta-alanine ligase [Nevskiaceae bacterium]